jgi:hypothetical protein
MTISVTEDTDVIRVAYGHQFKGTMGDEATLTADFKKGIKSLKHFVPETTKTWTSEGVECETPVFFTTVTEAYEHTNKPYTNKPYTNKHKITKVRSLHISNIVRFVI